MDFYIKVIIVLVIIFIISLIFYYVFKPNKKKLSYNDMFEGVLNGTEDINLWAVTLPPILGPVRLREAECLAEVLPEGKILVAKEINRVWVCNKMFLIEDQYTFLEKKRIRVSEALQKAYVSALGNYTKPFVFPSHITDGEVKYMNPIQKVKYKEWKAGITSELNTKLLKNRAAVQRSIRGRYLSNTKDYLEKNHLFREQVIPRAIKLFLARDENANRKPGKPFTYLENLEIDNITDELQNERAKNHLAKEVAKENLLKDILKNAEVPLPRYNANTWENPTIFAYQGGNQVGEGGLYNNYATAAAFEKLYNERETETIAERVNRVRKEDNLRNTEFSQSVHDAILATEINEAVKNRLQNEASSISSVDRLARDFARLYPVKAEEYRSLFAQDRDKDYLVAFADIVYDARNDEVRENLIDALGYEIDNIAPFCNEGRKNKTWSLLTGIDRTGNGEPIASRIDVVDSLMRDFGKITNTVGATQVEMIDLIKSKGVEYTEKYPLLKAEIQRKVSESTYAVNDLYDDEVNLYGNTSGIGFGSDGLSSIGALGALGGDNPGGDIDNLGIAPGDEQQGFWADQIGAEFGEKKDNLVYADLIPQERTLADPGAFRLDPGFPAGSYGSGTGDVFEPSLDTVPSTDMAPPPGPENFSIDALPNNIPPVASLLPVDNSNVTPTTPGAVFDLNTPLVVEE